MKTKYLILFAALFLFLTTQASSRLNIYFLVNDSHVSPDQLKSMVNLIYLSSKLKANKFTIIHFTSKQEANATWVQNKKSVEYKPLFKTCDFSLCGTLNTLISSNKTEHNKLYFCNSDLPCDAGVWNLETGRLTSKSEAMIQDKIKEEISLNKDAKNYSTLFFYISGDVPELKPTVIFEKDTIEAKADDVVSLRPTYAGSIAKIEWLPVNGLSCSDCREPNVKLQTTNTYTVTVSDSSSCKNSASKSITVNVKKSCFCSKGILLPVSDLLSDPLVKKYRTGLAIADYQISSNESGGWVFDFLTTPNCAASFQATLKEIDSKNKSKDIWQQQYLRNEVDEHGNFELLKKHPGKFVFRLYLDDIKENLQDPESVFILQIDSYDDENHSCHPYVSPKLIFAKCGQ